MAGWRGARARHNVEWRAPCAGETTVKRVRLIAVEADSITYEVMVGSESRTATVLAAGKRIEFPHNLADAGETLGPELDEEIRVRAREEVARLAAVARIARSAAAGAIHQLDQDYHDLGRWT